MILAASRRLELELDDLQTDLEEVDRLEDRERESRSTVEDPELEQPAGEEGEIVRLDALLVACSL